MAPIPDDLMPSAPTVIYDDDCPFCRNYVGMLRFREAVGPVTLQDARAGGPLVAALTDAGYDLDQGMILLINGEVHHGADAITRISLLSSQSTWFNRLNAAIFRHPRLSRILYPILRHGRNLTLRLLGRTPINTRTRRLSFSSYKTWCLVLALAVPAYVAVAHPGRTPGLDQFTQGHSEIFPFFNWSLFSAPKSVGTRFSIRVTEAAPNSTLPLETVLATDDASFLQNVKFSKTLRRFADPALADDPARLATTVANVSNYIRPYGAEEFEVVVELFDPLEQGAERIVRVVSGKHAVIAQGGRS
ncbi:MAG: DCC1-like thiol-disulfide oxidoreductase family protein [Pseudomonadota bacterium]